MATLKYWLGAYYKLRVVTMKPTAGIIDLFKNAVAGDPALKADAEARLAAIKQLESKTGANKLHKRDYIASIDKEVLSQVLG